MVLCTCVLACSTSASLLKSERIVDGTSILHVNGDKPSSIVNFICAVFNLIVYYISIITTT